MFKSCTRIVCIEPVRWGWGGSGNCASHVTQRKCDGVLLSGNCSEGVVSSFPCGFIKSFWLWYPSGRHLYEAIAKIVRILHAYNNVHDCIELVRWGWGRSGKCASHVTQRKCDGVLFSGNYSEGLFHRFHVVLLKFIWLWYPSGRHLYEAIS